MRGGVAFGLVAGFALAWIVLELLPGWTATDSNAVLDEADREATYADGDDGDDDDDAVPSRLVTAADGGRRVELDDAERALAGIAVTPLTAGSAADERLTVGVIVDHAPLLGHALRIEGNLLERAGRRERAALILERAYVTAIAVGDDAEAARAARRPTRRPPATRRRTTGCTSRPTRATRASSGPTTGSRASPCAR